MPYAQPGTTPDKQKQKTAQKNTATHHVTKTGRPPTATKVKLPHPKIPSWASGMSDYLKHHNSNNYYIRRGNQGRNEGGVDLGAPHGTPITALAGGRIIAIGYHLFHGNGNPIYGVVTMRVKVPGHGWQDIYYQHLDLIPGLHVGQTITKGQLIGHVGAYSMTEVGFNAGWG